MRQCRIWREQFSQAELQCSVGVDLWYDLLKLIIVTWIIMWIKGGSGDS